MTHKEIYNLTTSIHESDAMQKSELCTESAIEAVNILREHVKTLIKVVFDAKIETNEIKKVADMYKKIDKAKERIFIDAVDKKIEKDWDDITSYDARTEKPVKASLSHVSTKTVDNTATLDDCLTD